MPATKPPQQVHAEVVVECDGRLWFEVKETGAIGRLTQIMWRREQHGKLQVYVGLGPKDKFDLSDWQLWQRDDEVVCVG